MSSLCLVNGAVGQWNKKRIGKQSSIIIHQKKKKERKLRIFSGQINEWSYCLVILPQILLPFPNCQRLIIHILYFSVTDCFAFLPQNTCHILPVSSVMKIRIGCCHPIPKVILMCPASWARTHYVLSHCHGCTQSRAAESLGLRSRHLAQESEFPITGGS